jgi:nucleoside-diphosphate-sugar epimerase
MKNKTILITGSSGFIGYHVAKLLLEKNYKSNISNIIRKILISIKTYNQNF